ncbi:response regulator transcription factor [Salibacterium qingdaonense]|uniref:Two-component system, response regulator YesN n=1 Tax=Salibacterium qingdaonense TaxID=266892 RepID=A0A1I4I0P9_9BACI|nr:response regulator transcription factor [Salibacterium qingdaonense]SFL48012.1 two-component system, response regulator YesN [Salibacterium qingdaonense]
MWKIVIIDDEDKVLRGMKRIVPWEALNCEWSGEAKNGQQGLEVIRRVQPDLVITDVYMPVKNGLDMVEELRNEGYEGRVVILSGYSDFEYARKAMRLDIDDYLSKPASRTTIEEVLKNVVARLEERTMEKLQFLELRKKVQWYEPLIEKEWIKSIVTGTSMGTDPPEALQPLLKQWEKQDHFIILLTYTNQLEESDLFQKDWYLFRFAAGNVIKEAVRQRFLDFEFIECHTHQTALFVHVPKGFQDEENMRETVKQEVKESLRIYLHLDVIITFSSFTGNWADIHTSTKEAIEHLPLRSDVPLLPEVKEETGWTGQLPVLTDSMEWNQQLSSAIRYADEGKACTIIDGLFEKLRHETFHQPSAVHLGIEMWTMMTYALFDIGIRIRDMFPEHFDIYSVLSRQQSWEGTASELKEIVMKICHHQKWDENLKHRQLVEQMTAFVQERLHENITLHDLSDELFISRNYLGRIFKKVAGESFKDYLTRVRMEKASNMIQEGHYLIYEIAERVGYGNPAYFSSLFKKYTGYTPTELIQKRTVGQ